jgi:hypothetical protein
LPFAFAGCLLALALATPATANEPGNGDDEMPFAFDDLQVPGYQLRMDEELALRVVWLGMQEARSSRKEDRNRIVCRHRVQTGSHLGYIYCGSNAAWDAGNVAASMAGGSSFTTVLAELHDRQFMAGGMYVSERPISRVRLDALFRELRSLEHSEEILAQAIGASGRLPKLVRDGTVHLMAELYLDIDAVHYDYSKKLAQTSDEEARQRLVAEMDARLENLLDKAGMGVNEYHEVVAAIEGDRRLKAYVEDTTTLLVRERTPERIVIRSPGSRASTD